jgi:hypothetical protein
MMKTKEEYADFVKNFQDFIKSGNYPKCPCPKTYCGWHGKCFECVLLHRHQGRHVPNCLNHILADKIKSLAETAELEVSEKKMTPKEYWDYVKLVLPDNDI